MLETWASTSKGIQKTCPVNCHPEVIVFIWRKEARNLIRHEKVKCKTFLSELCLLNEGDECTLHHEFSKTLKEKSDEFVTLVLENIQRHGRPFNIKKPKELVSITICLFLQNMSMISYLFWLAGILVCFW